MNNNAWTRGSRLHAKLSSILESPGSDSSAEELSSQNHTPDANDFDSAAKLSSTLESPGPDSTTENFSRWIRTPDMNGIDSASGGHASALATVSGLQEQQDPDSTSAVSLVIKTNQNNFTDSAKLDRIPGGGTSSQEQLTQQQSANKGVVHYTSCSPRQDAQWKPLGNTLKTVHSPSQSGRRSHWSWFPESPPQIWEGGYSHTLSPHKMGEQA